MLAKRSMAKVPLKEPTYTAAQIPWAPKNLEGSVVLKPTRKEMQDSMAEIVNLCNEATHRQVTKQVQKKRAVDPNSPMRFSSKPLSIEFIADRLDIDDPLHGITIRTAAEGMLQGMVSYTAFTTWQRHFRWDSKCENASMDEWGGDVAELHLRKKDDGTLAAELNNQIFEGDPDDGGIVWPRIAEIALLGALGCGRWLGEAVIEELEKLSSQFQYVVLQATDGSVPFYESLGFVRVGAVARYDLQIEEDETPPSADGSTAAARPAPAEYNFKKAHQSSPTYWYTDTKDDETPRKIAAKTGVDVFEIMFLNKLLYGEDGLTAGSRLKRGTPLRMPVKDGSVGIAKLKGAMYTTTSNKETCKRVAGRLSISADELVQLNRHRHHGLAVSSTLQKGTQLLLPDPDGQATDLSKLTDEVAYRHWTFNDDLVDFTEASYMMALRLKPAKDRTNESRLDRLGVKLGRGAPPVLKIPSGCKRRDAYTDPEVRVKLKKSRAPRSRLKAPSKPKSTAASIFRAKELRSFRQHFPGLTDAQLYTEIDANWQAMAPSEKIPFKKASAKNREEYEAKMQVHRRLKKIEVKELKAVAKERKKGMTSGAGGMVPSKLFNKVVVARGHPGVWFVLTYIPDLQWVHLGPMRQVGVFEDDRKGKAATHVGKPKWMLAPEGTAPELDLTAFNVTVLKSSTVKKTQNADKEEWALPELPGWVLGTAPMPVTDDEEEGTAGAGTLHPTVATAAPSNGVVAMDTGPDLTVAVAPGDGGNATTAGPVITDFFATDTSDSASAAAPPAIPVAGSVAPAGPANPQGGSGANGASPVKERKESAAPSWFIPSASNTARGSKQADKKAASNMTYKKGALVCANWNGRGTYYPGQVTAILPPSEDGKNTPKDRLYSVRYDDGDFEPAVPPGRIRTLQTAENAEKFAVFSLGEIVLGDWRGRGKMYSGQVIDIHEADQAVGLEKTYTILYEDNDCERHIHPRRLKKAPQSRVDARGGAEGRKRRRISSDVR